MYRSVIVSVIFASFVSCVLAETAVSKTVNGTNCKNDPIVVEHRNIMRRCFNTTVELHLHNASAELKPDDCKDATDFGEKLGAYFDKLTHACNISWKLDTTNLVKLVNFSLQNNSFRTFYEDMNCVRGVETNISNTCVKGKLGYFNITKESKHITWTRKALLQYDKNTCGNSLLVRNCVVVKLQHKCRDTTSQYVKNLFDYARELGNCSQYPPLSTVPPPSGNGDSSVTAAWLTTPVIITLGIGGVVVVAAIITIIVLKCKN